jgi:hypothetical protein
MKGVWRALIGLQQSKQPSCLVVSVVIEGAVSLDFLPLLVKQTPCVPDSWAKAISNIL